MFDTYIAINIGLHVGISPGGKHLLRHAKWSHTKLFEELLWWFEKEVSCSSTNIQPFISVKWIVLNLTYHIYIHSKNTCGIKLDLYWQISNPDFNHVGCKAVLKFLYTENAVV